MKWPDVVLGELLDQDPSVIRIDDPANEKFMTIRLYGLGVIERRIGAGKTPRPSSGYRVRAGQFVYSRIDARNGAFGIVPEGLDGAVCSKDFPVFDHRKDRVCLTYLLHMVCSDGFRRRVQDLSFGATNRQRVKEEEFLRLTIPLPPLPEQRRIAAILDHADALRAKRRDSLTALSEFAESVFIDMFGHPAVQNEGSTVARIGDLGTVTTGNTPPRSDGDLYGSHIEWIKSNNITSDPYLSQAVERLSREGLKKARIAPVGSLLVTCIAGSPNSIGGVAIADRKVSFNQQINAFTPTAGPIEFWYTQFKLAKPLVQAASTGGMKGLVSKSAFEAIQLMSPPVAEQELFACRVKRSWATLARQKDDYQSLNKLFRCLQYRAFRGEL